MINANSLFEMDFKNYRPDIVESVIANCRASKPVSQYNTPSCQYKVWTILETEDLIYMYDLGWSTRAICNELHRTPGGVRGKLRRLGRI